jgi:hypothetical protein
LFPDLGGLLPGSFRGEFGDEQTAIAGKPAAPAARRNKDLLTAGAGDGFELRSEVHLHQRTGGMQGD